MEDRDGLFESTAYHNKGHLLFLLEQWTKYDFNHFDFKRHFAITVDEAENAELASITLDLLSDDCRAKLLNYITNAALQISYEKAESTMEAPENKAFSEIILTFLKHEFPQIDTVDDDPTHGFKNGH